MKKEETINVKIDTLLAILNLIVFIIGMSFLWHETHSYIVLFWGFIASLNFRYKK